MNSELLLTPGPVKIPEEVMQAMANSNIHHRTNEFEKIFSETLDLYQELVKSPTRPIFLACSGTGAMEASIVNTCNSDDTILVLEAGKFGERWCLIAEKLGLKHEVLKANWGETFDLSLVEEFITKHKDAKLVCCQYCETSTTSLHNAKALAELVKKVAPQMLFILDGITAVGTKAINQSEANYDILITGSQKALMLPPGLAIVSCSQLAWDTIQKNNPKSLYFNFLIEKKFHAQNTTAFTPAISLIFALNASLKRIFKEGLNNVYSRHQENSIFLRENLKNLGFKLLAENCPSPSVTGGYPPDKIDADQLRKKILSEYGIRIAEGQDSLKGKIIRIGHMGCIDTSDLNRLIVAIRNIL
jgi:aspartate aminotransferase-like enzyme